MFDAGIPLWLAAGQTVLIVLLLIVIWSLKHRRNPRLRFSSEADFPELVRSIAGLTHAYLIGGNSVEIIENGPFFDQLLADIRAARHSVHFETFLWKEGELGARIAAALADAARRGVCVRVLVDARGSRDMGEEAERMLRESGCKLAKYRSGRLRTIGRINNRDHRKVVVIDGLIAYVGGHCVVDTWLGNAEDRKHFRDISAKVHGPAVQSVQSAFSENWVATTAEIFLGDDVFPALERQGDVPIHAARVRPAGSASAAKILHHLVLCYARERIWIQNPYFLPNSSAIELLGQAVARGVEVRVMTPSLDATDVPIVQHAAYHNYGKLLSAGVHILEYRKTLLHQKVMVVDGCWAAIGSTNFDDRSFEINDEITLGFSSESVAAELEAIFERDAKECVELTYEAWAHRGLYRRFIDGTLYLFKEQL